MNQATEGATVTVSTDDDVSIITGTAQVMVAFRIDQQTASDKRKMNQIVDRLSRAIEDMP